MKKTSLLIFSLLLSVGLYAQDRGYVIMEFNLKDGFYQELLDNWIKYSEPEKIIDGSVILLQEIGVGGDNMSHRMVYSWELGVEWYEGVFDPMKQDLSWALLDNMVEEWGEQYIGRILSWKGGDSKNNYAHVWDLKVDNPMQFKIAHDKLVKRFEKEFEGRSVGFGSYDFNKPNGASHWVTVSGSGNEDHLMLYNEFEKHSDFFTLLSEKGTVEEVRDDQLETLISNSVLVN